MPIIFGIRYFLLSLTSQAPVNKLIDKKCSQKINNKASFANIEYKPSSPLYNSKPSKILPSKKIVYDKYAYPTAKSSWAITDCVIKFVN